VYPKAENSLEHQVGTMTAGCRDTIDSILSKYETVRNEVQQDSRIGLVLNTEFDNAITQHASDFVADISDSATSAQVSGVLAEIHRLYVNARDESRMTEQPMTPCLST
jgi:hypothetical protein